jgi:hypothetical protein
MADGVTLTQIPDSFLCGSETLQEIPQGELASKYIKYASVI